MDKVNPPLFDIGANLLDKQLSKNFSEVISILQNSFDDAVLLGCDENDFKKKIEEVLKKLEFSIGKE